VVLILLASAAVGVWWMQRETVPTGEIYAADKSYTLICTGCLAESPVTGPEAAKIKKDKKGMMECPKCKKFSAYYGEPKATRPEEKSDSGIVIP